MRDPGILAWTCLERVYQRIERASVLHLRPWGLSVAQFEVIARLGTAPGLTQQELADALLVTKGNVCQLLDRMAQDGLLERRPDGRANRVYLTDRGQTLHDDVVPRQKAMIADRFACLPAGGSRRLLALLRRLDRDPRSAQEVVR